MKGIWIPESGSLKSYSATTKGGAKSVIKIEVDIADHRDLGFFLRELDEIVAAQKASKTPPRKPAAGKAAPPLALPSPLLQLPYYHEEGAAE
ncbi:hypothetical protein [Ensifer canadensis]